MRRGPREWGSVPFSEETPDLFSLLAQLYVRVQHADDHLQTWKCSSLEVDHVDTLILTVHSFHNSE